MSISATPSFRQRFTFENWS